MSSWNRHLRRRPWLAAVLVLSAVVLAGCGLGAGPAPRAVQMLVTRDFGARELQALPAPHVSGLETVMSLLLRNDSVTTRFGGGFVQGIDGITAGNEAGEPIDWFYYVNGVQAGRGAADTNVHPGDHIWWDLHDWSQTQDVPAVVGSFPEPFLNGIDGKRLPVRVECASVPGYACRTVTARLREQGVPAGISGIGSGGGPHTLRVIVGPWPAVAGDLATENIPAGPRASGVYARFSRDGRTLTLLDRSAHAVRVLGTGSGLIAAVRHDQDAPAWVVAGSDAAGTDLAAREFQASVLSHHFAVAVTAQGVVPVPVEGGAG